MLQVKAKSNHHFSEIASFTFTINPPFYRSVWAKLFYFLLTVALLYFTYNWHQQKLKKQKFDLLQLQREKLNEQAKKYQEKLLLEQQQKLKKTLENKELELAKKIIDQKEINNLILSIKQKLEETQNSASQKLSVAKYKELQTFIDKKLNKDVSKEYEIAFDHSQAQFHENLLAKHPNLSIKDLRIASYILLNLSSKEIANILQVLPTSIDVHRSRLKKKLDVTTEINLREYLHLFTLKNTDTQN